MFIKVCDRANRKCVEQASATHLSVQRGGTGVYFGEKQKKKNSKQSDSSHTLLQQPTAAY